MNMNIDDMSTDTIKKYLEKRVKEDKGDKIFNGCLYSFKVFEWGNIHFYTQANGRGDETIIATADETLLVLKKVVELAIKRRGL